MNNCNPFGDNCAEIADKRPLIVLRDKKGKSEYRAANQTRKNVICLRFDGCVLDDNEVKKCDYLLLDCDDKIAHFIELKGGDMLHAIKQLVNSVTLTVHLLKEKQFAAVHAKLALSKTPKVVPAKEWLDLRRLMQKHNGDAYRQNTPFMDVI